ncbi:DUF2304 domain-containing protein [Cellulomonas fimi]|uniref:DUF2304 domain-containing protein n=1 Tax=Cellulomonas fimi TaxID=1708 RepID=UPI00235A08C9|nr:DUF2304 domain-containing protein [Cellulomonas fimi]
MSGYPFALALSVLLLGSIAWLLRSRRLREKYAGIWIVLALVVVVLGAFPGLLFGLARWVGVETPSNLLFAASLVVLLLVCIQLSTEISQLEEETRTIAEEVALLARRVDELAESAPPKTPADDERGPGATA